MASDFPTAERLLREKAFGIALVDLSLDPNDDTNRDGLKVFDRIWETHDQTSAILMTAHGDLEVGISVVKEYGAFDGTSKEHLSDVLDDLLKRAEDRCREKLDQAKVRAYQTFRGTQSEPDWEQSLTRIMHPTGGFKTLYGFMDKLFTEFLPAIPKRHLDPISTTNTYSVAVGDFWSRAIGAPVLALFGEADKVETACTDGGKLLLGRYPIGNVLRDRSLKNLRGVVYEYLEVNRDDFIT